jgi:hypothetical protein
MKKKMMKKVIWVILMSMKNFKRMSKKKSKLNQFKKRRKR